MKHTPTSRSLWLLGTVVALVLAASAILVGTGAVPRQARAASQASMLFAYVVPTNRGPVPACLPDGSNCSLANTVRHYIYVANANRLTNDGGTRVTMTNAFVVSSIDEAIFVDGIETFDDIWTPPPDTGSSSRWPATVFCPPTGDPCSVTSPAIDPGENTAIFHTNWVHAVGEPNGTYMFRFTIHGTLNGNPVDLTGSSPPIRMTS